MRRLKIKTHVTKTTEHVQTYTVDTNVVVTMDLYLAVDLVTCEGQNQCQVP